MKKYLKVAKLTFIESTEYRGRIIIWLLAGIVSPLLSIALWTSSLSSGSEVDGYTRSDLITYYIIVLIAGQAFFPHIINEIERKIQEGNLNSYLIKPLTLPKYTIFHESAWKVLEFSFGIPVYLLLIIIFKDDLYIAQKNMLLLLYTLCAFGIGYLINFCIDYCVGSLAFWMFKTSSISRIYDLVFNFSAGRYIPLVMLPVFFTKTLKFLPFSYSFYFPINILMGKIEGQEIINSGLLQLFWLAVVGIITYLVWRKGLKKYEAVGI